MILIIGGSLIALILFFKYYSIVKKTTPISTASAAQGAVSLSSSTIASIISDVKAGLASSAALPSGTQGVALPTS